MLKEGSAQLINDSADFDVFDDVADTLRFRGSIFFHSDLAAPWGMSLSPTSTPRFHVALEGGFHIGAGDEQIAVKPMDIVMLPQGDMHWIADQRGRTLVSSESAGEACSLGMPLFQDGDITNRLMCGLVEYDEAISHPVIGALPTIFHLSNVQQDDSIWITVKQIDSEILRTNQKKNTIIDRLAEVLFIQLLNRFVSENTHTSGFFAALGDVRLEKVLQLLHKYPEKLWTLDTVSSHAAMSRATLQRKFKAELGVSPMIYLSRWRMAKAYQMVKYSSLSLDRIAERVGFSDARTLRVAFQREYGLSPGKVRH